MPRKLYSTLNDDGTHPRNAPIWRAVEAHIYARQNDLGDFDGKCDHVLTNRSMSSKDITKVFGVHPLFYVLFEFENVCLLLRYMNLIPFKKMYKRTFFDCTSCVETCRIFLAPRSASSNCRLINKFSTLLQSISRFDTAWEF